MNIIGVVNGPTSTPEASGVVMTSQLNEALLQHQVPPAVVEAMRDTMLHATGSASIAAWTYANAMSRALDEYAVPGVKHQCTYLLLYMKHWRGAEARAAKKVLGRWAKSPD